MEEKNNQIHIISEETNEIQENPSKKILKTIEKHLEEYLCPAKYKNDLEMLQAAAAKEISGAIFPYFTASREALNEPFEEGMTFQEYFAHEATDEMLHYLEVIRRMSELDAFLRKEFIDHGLGKYLVGDEYPPISFWYGPFEYPEEDREKRWLKTIEHVVNAIDFELNTITFYQDLVKKAKHPKVKKTFIDVLEHEKEDLIDFNQMLFKLLYSDTPQVPDE